MPGTTAKSRTKTSNKGNTCQLKKKPYVRWLGSNLLNKINTSLISKSDNKKEIKKYILEHILFL